MDLKRRNFLFAFLSVIGCCSGQQILRPGPKKGMLAGNVTFDTQSLPSPLPRFLTISWTFDDSSGQKPVITSVSGTQKNFPNYVNRVILNQTTGSLQLSSLTVQDSGTYAVNMITDSGDTLTGQTVLKVYEPVADVTVKANVSNPVELNDTVSITCDAVGSELSFKWQNGSVDMVPGGRVTLSNGNRTLTISNILRFDCGPVICIAQNFFMRRSANLTFNISYGPENVAMTTDPQSNMYMSGSNLTLSCSAQSNPPMTFQWTFNGNILPDVGPVLKRAGIIPSMSGNYTCLAFNSKTLRYKASLPAQITVLDQLSGTKIIGPSTPLIAGNSSANLTCQASTGSVDTWVWLKDGKPLSPSNTLTFSSDKSSVFISTVQRSDSGEYQCKVINLVSNHIAQYKLTVNYGPEEVKVEGKKAVEVGTRVELKCFAHSEPPASFSWAFNGTAREVHTETYVIESAAYGNAGQYSCEASNNVTGKTILASHMLAVKDEGTLPEPLSGGAIAGIIIGVLIAVVIIACIAKKVMKKRKIESPY